MQAKAINVEGRDAVAIELDVPLSGLKPGSYLCQLNVIDDAAGSFAFPRFAVLVREPLRLRAYACGCAGIDLARNARQRLRRPAAIAQIMGAQVRNFGRGIARIVIFAYHSRCPVLPRFFAVRMGN